MITYRFYKVIPTLKRVEKYRTVWIDPTVSPEGSWLCWCHGSRAECIWWPWHAFHTSELSFKYFQSFQHLPTSKPLRCSRRPCSIHGERHRGLLTGTSNHTMTLRCWDLQNSRSRTMRMVRILLWVLPVLGVPARRGLKSQNATSQFGALWCFVAPQDMVLWTSIDVRRTYRLPYTSVSKNSSMSTVKCESQNKQKQFCTVSCQIHCEEVQTKAEGIA